MSTSGERMEVATGPAHETAPIRSASPSTPQTAAVDALVLDARARQSLVAVRSLGSRGLRVAALETCRGVPAFASRWCLRRLRAPSYEHGSEPYVAYLERVLDTAPTRVVIPCADGTVSVLRRSRARLERRAALALASEHALAIATSKIRTLEVARALGLGVPPGVTLYGMGELRAALREIGLPAVVKPATSWVEAPARGQRLASRLVTTVEEARQAVTDLTHAGSPVIMQRYLPGRREAVMLLYARDTVHARFAQWARRTVPPLGGVSVLRQSIAVPEDIGEAAERLVRAIGLEGYAEIEFRRDTDGTPYLMEINPRLSASVEIAVRSGVDFPYLLYRWASGQPLERQTGYITGLWMRHLGGDIRTSLDALRQRGRDGVETPGEVLRDFCAAFTLPASYDYVDRRDLLPVATAVSTFLWRAPAEVLRRLRSNQSL